MMDSLSSHLMRWALPKKTSRQGRLFSTYDKNKDSQISEARLWSCIKNLDLETLPVELVKQCKMSASLTSSTGHWQFLALCHVSNAMEPKIIKYSFGKNPHKIEQFTILWPFLDPSSYKIFHTPLTGTLPRLSSHPTHPLLQKDKKQKLSLQSTPTSLSTWR